MPGLPTRTARAPFRPASAVRAKQPIAPPVVTHSPLRTVTVDACVGEVTLTTAAFKNATYLPFGMSDSVLGGFYTAEIGAATIDFKNVPWQNHNSGEVVETDAVEPSPITFRNVDWKQPDERTEIAPLIEHAAKHKRFRKRKPVVKTFK